VSADDHGRPGSETAERRDVYMLKPRPWPKEGGRLGSGSARPESPRNNQHRASISPDASAVLRQISTGRDR
jgi:hypothetical protein